MKQKVIYSVLTVICFLFCIIVLLFFDKTAFIRGYTGDIAVVMMIYFFLMIFYDFKPVIIIVIVALFSCSVEFMQLAGMDKLLGIHDNFIFNIIFGSVFDPLDLMAYAVGISIACMIDLKLIRKKSG